MREVERAVAGLQLVGSTKEAAAAAVMASKEQVGKLEQLARAALLLRVNDVLTDDEAKRFSAALDRAPSEGFRRPPTRDR